MDLMPALFHFLSREAIYIVAFDLEQDLMDNVTKSEWDIMHKGTLINHVESCGGGRLVK